MKKWIIKVLFLISILNFFSIYKAFAAPTDITLSNNTIFENLTTWSNIGTLSTTDTVAGTYTYSFTCNTSWADDSSFAISGSDLNSNWIFNFDRQASYNICIRTDDWIWWVFDKNFTINVRVIDFEIPGWYSVTSWTFNRVTNNPFEWTYSIESDNLWANNSTSCFESNKEILVDSTLNFYRNVDSENNYDFLRFYIDGNQQAEWSWNVAWSQVSYNLTAWNRNLKWCYEKDWSVNTWADKAWVDLIEIIEPVNNIPTDITLSSQNIASNLPVWSIVWTMSTTDADATDTHTYSLWCTTPWVDDISFSVSWSDLLSWEIFDDNVKSTYDICLKTNDWRWGTFDKNFTINIDPEAPNNDPTDITISSNNIFENITIWNLVWSFTTIDPDTSDSHTYSLSCSSPWTDDSSFTISGSDLNSNWVFNSNSKPNYDICVRTDDWRWGILDKNFTINVRVIDFEIPGWYSVTSWTFNRVTNNPFEWTYSIESDNLWANNSTSCFESNKEILVDSTLNFYRNVDSENNYDFLRFYIDGNQQAEWSWNVAWSQVSYNLTAWNRNLKWCYEKDWSVNTWADKAWVDLIEIIEPLDTIAPIISSINYASWTLLPWWVQNIIINYSDASSWIDTTSDLITLNKWDWSIWWSDISATWLNLWAKTITSTVATYPTNNLLFWKYRYDFSINDNEWNSSSTWAVFYIDEPEIIISTWSLDIWNLQVWSNTFSPLDFTITVNTVWAWFDLIMNKESALSNWTVEIIDWNWADWFWYDKSPYTSTINIINNNEVLATQPPSINTDWNKNSYIYNINMWALILEEQEAWNYSWNINFWIDLNY